MLAQLNRCREPKAPNQVRTPSFARKRHKTKPQMNVHLSFGSAVPAYEDSLWRVLIAAPKPFGGRHVKFVFTLLVTALAVLVAQLIADAPVIQTRVGALGEMQVTYAFAGIRG
jgi:hypothetical protein